MGGGGGGVETPNNFLISYFPLFRSCGKTTSVERYNENLLQLANIYIHSLN